MAKHGKKYRAAAEKVEARPYQLDEAFVLLKQIADIYQTSGRYQVLHQGARRVQTVTANVAGTDLISFVKAAKALIRAQVDLPAGTYIQFAGAAEAESQSQRDLMVNSLIAAVGIILLLLKN